MSFQDSVNKMHSGKLYIADTPEDVVYQRACLDKQYEFNHTRPTEMDKREALLKEMFAEIGEGCYIEPPLHANWGGRFVKMGAHVYANFGLTLVDDGEITIGDGCMFAPNVILATAGHPIDPALRAEVYQYTQPIHIGNNVWIGAGAIVLPGVTIGDNTVIGAGSIVTRDIPANVVALGNPCRVLRQIGEHDKEYYFRDLKIGL